MIKEEKVNYGALRTWAGFDPRRIGLLLRISWRHQRAIGRHRRNQRLIDGSVPSILAISPTMRCNYNCKGCYSRGRPTHDELATGELDALYSEAEELGVHSIVVTGGEPFLRGDTVDLIARHRRLLFFIITNGSLMTSDIACRIARSANTIPLVSVEGFPGDTDERRHPGAHETVLCAFDHLRKTQALFGFVATNTAANTAQLGAEPFIDQMVALGAQLGSSLNTCPVVRTRGLTGSWTKPHELTSVSGFSNSGALNQLSLATSPTMNMAGRIAALQQDAYPFT